MISVPGSLDLTDFDEVFRTVLGWDGLGFIFRVHGQEFNSFRRATRSKTLCDFQLRLREAFLYTCGAIDLWECVGGRGAPPPEHCGGPTGYRLMLKRQKQGEAMCTPVQMEAMIGMFSAADPDERPVPGRRCAKRWTMVSKALIAGCKNADRWSQNASACKRPTSA